MKKGIVSPTNDRIAYFLEKYVIIADNNNMAYDYCQQALKLGYWIRKWKTLTKRNKFYNLRDIKQYIKEIVCKESSSTQTNESYQRKFGCLIKAICVSDMNNIRSFWRILYFQSNQKDQKLLQYAYTFCAQQDNPWITNHIELMNPINCTIKTIDSFVP